MNTTQRLALGVLTALILLLPSVARANTYTVEGCGTVGTGAFTFSSNPTAAFLWTSDCDPSHTVTLGVVGLGNTASHAQGQEGSWGVEAPADEYISGLAIEDGWYQAATGWLSGWSLNGDIDQTVLPAADDCMTASANSCSEMDSGWFPIADANSIQAILYCDAAAVASEACNASDVAASSTVQDVVVQLDDPGNVTPQVSGSLWAAGQGDGLNEGWLSGINAGASLSASFQASDPGGICTLGAELVSSSGSAVYASRPVDEAPTVDSGSIAATAYSLPAPFSTTEPCGATSTATATFSPDLASLPTGTYYLNVEAQNPGDYQTGTYAYAAGDSLTGGEQINIDNSIPSITVTPDSSGETVGADAGSWSSTPESVTVDATDAADSSGLAQITCTTPAGTTSYPVSGDQASVVVNISVPGDDYADCDATSVAGNTSAVASTAFSVDAQTPTVSFSGAIAAPDWIDSTSTVTATGSEAIQASGIASVTCQVDGGAWAATPGTVANLTVAGNGTHEVSCFSTTIAGLNSVTTSEQVQVDAQSPTLSLSGGPNQADWSTKTQTIDAIATAVGGDTIKQISCALDGTTVNYPNTGAQPTESVVISVPAPGGDLSCQAQDSAGNVSSSKSWSFLIDDTAPTGHFMSGNPADPTQVAVEVTDVGSGVAGVTIELYVNGSWESLATTPTSAAGLATAQIPDSALPKGTYRLRARVWDHAGNIGYITQDAAGSGASIRLPLREVTELTAVFSSGRARVAASASAGAKKLSLRFGRRSEIAGRLVTAGGVPVRHAVIVVSQKLAGASVNKVLARIRTNAKGGFRYQLGAGPSRTVLVTYSGSSALRSATRETAVRVSGRVTLAGPHALTAGERVSLSGRVLGGHVPRAGLLVQLWYSSAGGRGGWQPFEHAVHSRANGRWALTFPVSAAAEGREYAFKAVVAAQGGWPYAGAVSTSAKLKVL